MFKTVVSSFFFFLIFLLYWSERNCKNRHGDSEEFPGICLVLRSGDDGDVCFIAFRHSRLGGIRSIERVPYAGL